MASNDATTANVSSALAQLRELQPGEPAIPAAPATGAETTGPTDYRAVNEQGQSLQFWPVRGMRLPSEYKVAFSHTALFSQQRDMRTHDASVQQMLMALHQAADMLVRRITNNAVSCGELTSLKFNVNFADAAGEHVKTYKVQLTHPAHVQFDLVQRINPRTLSTYWRARYNDWDMNVGASGLPAVELADVPLPTSERPLRSIDVD